jgi:hypothetical protein
VAIVILNMQLRSLVFTWNNYTEESVAQLKAYFSDARYMVIGFEEGEQNGTPHLQGYIQLKKRVTFDKLRKLFPWHIEQVRGTPKQAADYCKDPNKKGGSGNFIEFGELSDHSQGGEKSHERYSLILDYARRGELDLIAEQYPSEYLRFHRNLHMVHVEAMTSCEGEKQCFWLWGKPGTGKSRFVYDVGGDQCYWKNPNKWWDNYSSQKCVILDDFGKEHSVLGYHIKRWADRYPVLCESKGSSLYPNYNTLFITSNYHPSDIFQDEEMRNAIIRRFKIIEVVGYEESLEGLLSIKTPDTYDYKLINKFTLRD